MDIKAYISVIAVVLTFVSYIPYLRNIYLKKTKPHAITWFIWSSLNLVAYLAQLHSGGGVGAWALGFTSLANIIIFLLALKYGERDIKKFDWYSLFGAGLAGVLWAITNDPLLSVILVTIIDILGFLPTIRKSIKKPMEETLITYFISTIKYLLIILAIENYNATTLIFPVGVFLIHPIFIFMVLYFRSKKV